jgi:type III pantothenate kinase
MLLAIDVGNTHIVCGLWDGEKWVALWRKVTDIQDTEDELAAWLKSMFDLSQFPWKVERAICASVVPSLDLAINQMCLRWLGVGTWFLKSGEQIGLPVDYSPPTAVGADRLANAVGALALYPAPIVVVDFGTATTFDTIDKHGHYVGGAILPGVQISSQALFSKAAKLPTVEYKAPKSAIGKDTAQSLQSGIMFGYADAIDGLARRISSELEGDVTIVATGGLGGMFVGLCDLISVFEPTLTLDGLRRAFETAKDRP